MGLDQGSNADKFYKRMASMAMFFAFFIATSKHFQSLFLLC